MGWEAITITTRLGFKIGKNPNTKLPCDIPYYAEHPNAFALVKCEIERRGWSWACSFGAIESNRYAFAITDLENHTSGRFAESEELAGCLAVKAALESV